MVCAAAAAAATAAPANCRERRGCHVVPPPPMPTGMPSAANPALASTRGAGATGHVHGRTAAADRAAVLGCTQRPCGRGGTHTSSRRTSLRVRLRRPSVGAAAARDARAARWRARTAAARHARRRSRGHAAARGPISAARVSPLRGAVLAGRGRRVARREGWRGRSSVLPNPRWPPRRGVSRSRCKDRGTHSAS